MSAQSVVTLARLVAGSGGMALSAIWLLTL